MRKTYIYMAIWTIALAMSLYSFSCRAQTHDHPHNSASLTYQHNFDTIINNLEYVTVRYFTGDQKLFHLNYLIKRGDGYFYPNLYPVQVINYKQKDSAEVVLKRRDTVKWTPYYYKPKP